MKIQISTFTNVSENLCKCKFRLWEKSCTMRAQNIILQKLCLKHSWRSWSSFIYSFLLLKLVIYPHIINILWHIQFSIFAYKWKSRWKKSICRYTSGGVSKGLQNEKKMLSYLEKSFCRETMLFLLKDKNNQNSHFQFNLS